MVNWRGPSFTVNIVNWLAVRERTSPFPPVWVWALQNANIMASLLVQGPKPTAACCPLDLKDNRELIMQSRCGVCDQDKYVDNTRPVAANAQRVSCHMFEKIPNVPVIMFAGLPQGDGVLCETAQLGWGSGKELWWKKKTLLSQPLVSISTYLWKHLVEWTQLRFNGGCSSRLNKKGEGGWINYWLTLVLPF